MQIIPYNPTHYELLLQRRDHPFFPAVLTHRHFVDWYYGSGHCRLHLFLNDREELAGIIGIDIVDFTYQNNVIQVATASNNVAFLPGFGGFQFLCWLKAAPYTLALGGSQAIHQIIRQNGWHYFPPVPQLLANRRFHIDPTDFSWRALAKRSLAPLLPTIKLADKREAILRQSGSLSAAGSGVAIREEQTFQAEMLPTTTPFRFRFSPSLAYLQWRYATGLPFVCYRLFRILYGRETVGYVVLKESPEQLLVSQCDGVDPVLLACGVLLALAAVTEHDLVPREMRLCSSHSVMQRLFRRFGFHDWRQPCTFVMGALRHPLIQEEACRDWLINFDWSDNGLRRPFLDE
ncbi:MAG: hypothetical protein HQL90_00965 [Magnetococcales bacterium]|nr:hypothetical protein [Magnetococcales bacterium]